MSSVQIPRVSEMPVLPAGPALPTGGNHKPRGFVLSQATVEPDPTGTGTAPDGQDDAVTDDSTATVVHRAAAYVTEQGVTPEQHKALGVVAQKMIQDGDEDGAGTALADALNSHLPLDCTDPAAVTAHMLGLAEGIVHSARLAADPRLSDPTYRVAPADSDDWFRHLHQAEIATHTAEDSDNPREEFHQRRILAQVQAYAQYWGSGHGRTLKGEYAAQLVNAAVFLVTEAVTASLAGLQTNPHDVADRLHRAVDRAQAEHLHSILPGHYTPRSAYGNERFSTADRAMADALRYSRDQATTVAGLRSALELIIIEAGDATPVGGLVEDVQTEPPKSQKAQPTGGQA